MRDGSAREAPSRVQAGLGEGGGGEGGGEGLPSSFYLWVAAQGGEWSKHMLIGCLGTGKPKARKLPDKHGQKDVLPEILATNTLHKCLLRMLILTRL